MEFSSRTGTYSFLPTITLLLLITFNAINLSRGASSSSCNGSINGCVVVADEAADFEFLMDSDNSRMLLDPGEAFTAGTGKRNQAAGSCGRYKPYKSCLPDPNRPRVPENCGGTYNPNRACR